jgi:hypothetical protein
MSARILVKRMKRICWTSPEGGTGSRVTGWVLDPASPLGVGSAVSARPQHRVAHIPDIARSRKAGFCYAFLSILAELCESPTSARVVDCDPHYKYGVRHHLEGLPPLCVLHGNADELSPFSQSVELARDALRVLRLRRPVPLLCADRGRCHHPADVPGFGGLPS